MASAPAGVTPFTRLSLAGGGAGSRYNHPLMLPMEWVVDMLFGTLYGGLVMVAALLAALPYGIWQGLKRLGAWIKGGSPRGNN
jgi:hypothetical protein